MLLRETYCDIGTKNKIEDLSEFDAVFANKSHTEDALRLGTLRYAYFICS